VLSPSNGMQQAGASFLKNDVGPALAIVAPFVGGEEAGALPNEAIVVRGGENTPANFVNGKGVTVDANGNLQGVSVNSAPGKTVEELSQGLPHGKVGVTKVGEVRNAGGEVTPSPTPNNPNHCTMCGITPEKASSLMKVVPNPARLAPPPPARLKNDE
jgi:hypothetical protein